MTVITTLVTPHFTVHATDSYLTKRQPYELLEKERTKIVPVRRFRGAMSYWGWATLPASNAAPEWNTIAWLREQARQAGSFDSAGAFALSLMRNLECEGRKRSVYRGIGIHFSCYERIGDYWVPEVFIISNYEDASYRSLDQDGLIVSRNFHIDLVGISRADIINVNRDARLKAYRILLEGQNGWWYNGDPAVFGPVTDAFMNAITLLQKRGSLKLQTWKEHADLARMPVELVSRMFKSFSIENRILVGGKPHDLVISPNGDYYSTTGDR